MRSIILLIQKDFQEYHAHLLEALQQEGPYNISKIFGFINHYLLGIMPSNFESLVTPSTK